MIPARRRKATFPRASPSLPLSLFLSLSLSLSLTPLCLFREQTLGGS